MMVAVPRSPRDWVPRKAESLQQRVASRSERNLVIRNRLGLVRHFGGLRFYLLDNCPNVRHAVGRNMSHDRRIQPGGTLQNGLNVLCSLFRKPLCKVSVAKAVQD